MDEFKEILQMVLEKVDAIDTRVKAIEDEILNPVLEGMEVKRYEDFKDKYSDKLGSLDEPTKNIVGKDFDIFKEAYDSSRGIPEDEMDAAIEGYADKIAGEIDELREKLGISPDAEITIESEGTGEAEVKVEGETVDESGEVSEATEATDEVSPEGEEVKETEDVAEEEAVPEEETENEDELMEELRKEKSKYINM